MKEVISQLQNSAVFSGIPPQEISALLGCLRPVLRRYEKNEIIWQEGEPAHTVGLILRGKVMILRDDFWGNRSILGEAAAGDLFGEAYACATAHTLTVSVLAAEPCEVLFVEIAHTLETCSHVCSFHLRLIQNLIHILASKNLMLARKIDHLSRRTTREKLLAYLSWQAQLHQTATFDIPFNRQQLADYLSVDRSALSQELGRMKRDGLVDFTRSHFTLLSDRSES